MKTILALALVLAIGAGALAQEAKPAGTLPPVELTKEEALQVMSLQFNLIVLQEQANSLMARREELTKRMETKYKISFQNYSLDVNTGYFVPRPQEGEAPAGEPKAEQIQASADDALQLMNLEYAIAGVDGNARQVFAKRQELLKKFEDEYKVSFNDYDIDLMNGRLVQRQAQAQPPAPTPAATAPAAAPKK
jgi:hypothetical protein